MHSFGKDRTRQRQVLPSRHLDVGRGARTNSGESPTPLDRACFIGEPSSGSALERARSDANRNICGVWANQSPSRSHASQPPPIVAHASTYRPAASRAGHHGRRCQPRRSSAPALLSPRHGRAASCTSTRSSRCVRVAICDSPFVHFAPATHRRPPETRRARACGTIRVPLLRPIGATTTKTRSMRASTSTRQSNAPASCALQGADTVWASSTQTGANACSRNQRDITKWYRARLSQAGDCSTL